MINLHSFDTRHWKYLGDDDRKSPFRKIRFRNVSYRAIPPLPDEWIVEKILAQGALDNLNEQARGIVYTMIETGCRPWEIYNPKAEHIDLDH